MGSNNSNSVSECILSVLKENLDLVTNLLWCNEVTENSIMVW